MSYLFWLVLPLAIWLMAWIIIDFIVTDHKGELEDVIHAKWGKDNEPKFNMAAENIDNIFVDSNKSFNEKEYWEKRTETYLKETKNINKFSNKN